MADRPLQKLAQKLRDRAAALKREVHVLALAYADPRTPWLARAVVWMTVAYALSPIDLIPDPIPILGYLDDLLIVPAGIALAIRLVPPEVLAQAREKAANPDVENALGRRGAVLVVIVWAAALILTAAIAWRLMRR